MRRKYKWLAVRPIHESHHCGSTLQPLLLTFVHYTMYYDTRVIISNSTQAAPTVRWTTIILYKLPNYKWSERLLEGECRLCMHRIVAGYD